jgi:tetratricopeptide (TPR) repeat protein
MAACYGDQGDAANEVKYYRLSLHQYPITPEWLYDSNHVEWILAFTVALVSNGETSEARWWWRSVDALFQSKAGSGHLGDKRFDAGDYRGAFQAYYRSLYDSSSDNPDYTGYRSAENDNYADDKLSHGLQLAGDGDYAGAIAEWNRANDMFSTFNRPNFSEPTFFIGCAEFALGHRDLARQSWIRVLTLFDVPPQAAGGPVYPENEHLEAVHFLVRHGFPQ